jgi:hypothetical protein
MAFLDSFSNPFEGMNVFGARAPSYLGGILDQNEIDKLKQQSLVQGLLGTAATYLAQPKNQRYGSALPYLGKAFMGGMQQSQDVYDKATQDYLTKQKFEQQATQKKFIDKFTETNPELGGVLQAFPSAAGDILGKVYTPKPMGVSEKTNEYSVANYGKPFMQLLPAEQKDVLKQIASISGMNINLSSPIAGVDAQGNTVFFQSNPKGGAPSVVSGIVPKASEAQTKQIMGIENTQRAIGDYKQALKTWSPTDAIDPVKRAEMGTYYNNMMLQAKEAYNLGVLNGNDYKILTDVIADPTSAKGIAYASFGALDKQADALNNIMEKMKTGMQGKTTSSITSPANKLSTPSKKLTDQELQDLYLKKR